MIVSRGAQNRLPESQRINKSVWGFGVRVLSSLLAHFMLYTLIFFFTGHFLTIWRYSLDWGFWDVGLSGIVWRVPHLNWGRRCMAIGPTYHVRLPKTLPRSSSLVCTYMISFHSLLSQLFYHMRFLASLSSRLVCIVDQQSDKHKRMCVELFFYWFVYRWPATSWMQHQNSPLSFTFPPHKFTLNQERAELTTQKGVVQVYISGLLSSFSNRAWDEPLNRPKYTVCIFLLSWQMFYFQNWPSEVIVSSVIYE